MKGFVIDGSFLLPVQMYMERLEIPYARLRRPNRRYLTDVDGSRLPVIHVDGD